MKLEIKRQKIKAEIKEKQKELRKVTNKIAKEAWRARQEQILYTENE